MSRSSDAEGMAVIFFSVIFCCLFLTLTTGEILHWVPLLAALFVGMWITSIIDG